MGDDYVVGDIHSQFDKLENKLNEIEFDKTKGRLFCTSGLIDRSEDGYRVLDYLRQDYFYSVN